MIEKRLINDIIDDVGGKEKKERVPMKMLNTYMKKWSTKKTK